MGKILNTQASEVGTVPEPREKLLLRFRLFQVLSAMKHVVSDSALDADMCVYQPARMDVFRRSLNRLAATAERFAKTIAALDRDFESHFADNRRRVVAYAWELAHLIRPDNQRITYEFAIACLKANRKKIARAKLDELALPDPNGTKYSASATRRLARMAWVEGEVEKALRLIRAVRGRVAREQYKTWLAELGVRNGLLLAERGNFKSAEYSLIGGLLARGFNEEDARAVTSIYLRASGWESSRQETRDARMREIPVTANKKVLPKAVILAGFGWSGSGAVLDYLKGHPSVEDIFAGRELGLWTGKYGLDRLYVHFTTKGYSRRIILEFLARYCFGHTFIAENRGIKNLGGLWSMLDDEKRQSFLELLDSWVEVAAQFDGKQVDKLLAASQQLSSGIIGLLANPGASHVVLSNCITSEAISGIRLFVDPSVIVSWRNPGDAYASKASAFPDIALGFDGWKRQLSRRINNYLDNKRKVVQYACLWKDISFEEFILNEKARLELLDSLGLSRERLASTFDPAVSARNIGIHRGLKEKGDWDVFSDKVETARREAERI